PPILVGHLVPSTGVDAPMAEHARQGIVLAVEEVNQEDRLIQGRRVEVIHPEVGPDPEVHRAAAVRLITINRVTALIGGSDPQQVDSLVESLGLVSETAKVPLLVTGGRPGRPANHFVFYLGMTPAYHGRILGRFAAEEWQGKSIAILLGVREKKEHLHRALAEAFAKEFGKSSGQTLGPWTFKSSDDVQDLTRRVTGQGPAAILLAGSTDDLAAFSKAGLPENLPVILGGPDGSELLVTNLEISNPIYLATAFAAQEKHEKSQDFIRRFQENFHAAPDVHSALAYDITRFLLEGLCNAKSLEGSKVREALAEIKTFAGVTGDVHLNEDNTVVRPVFILKVSKGQVKTQKTYEATKDG
ncbi:MAG TPA: ABC transporter substrate-binding protein, partial [Gemmataceae bacterium]|nr:ABC transporter substrate-binding protein [Gemmataceae bacterium]